MHWHSQMYGRVVGVWGYGLEGQAATAWAQQFARRIVVVDEREDVQLVIDHARPAQSDTGFYTGSDALRRLLDCDLVILSPGVPITHPFIGQLSTARITLTSGATIWLEVNAWRTVGVTGTKGKSTTASLIYHLLTETGTQAVLAGNVGRPLITVPDGQEPVIAELSSYQCARITKSPRVAVITNLFEEHIPWHGSLERYWLDKARIFQFGSEALVCDEPTLDKLSELVTVPNSLEIRRGGDWPSPLSVDDEETGAIESLPPAMRASHNVRNLRLAVAAVSAYEGSEIDYVDLVKHIRTFVPLKHRLEIVGTTEDGITWVDDTLSTAAESVVAAMEAVDGKHTILILGGKDRGISYQKLNSYLIAHASTIEVLACPTNGMLAAETFAAQFPDKVRHVRNLDEAVELAYRLGHHGSHVVLSPGAPSYDHYRDYREKSMRYRAAIRNVTGLHT